MIALLPADMMTLRSFAAPAILRETTGVLVPAELLRCMSRVLALSGRGLSARPGQLSGAKRTFAPDQRTSSKVIHCGGAVFRCDRARRKGDEWHANGAEIALHG